MPADIVNLRRARKAKARVEREATAATNQRLFGRSKDEKQKDATEREIAERRIDGHRRDRDDS